MVYLVALNRSTPPYGVGLSERCSETVLREWHEAQRHCPFAMSYRKSGRAMTAMM